VLQLQDRGEAYLNFTGTLSTKATLKHYLFLIKRYAVFRKTLDLDKIIQDDSKTSPKLAAAHVREFLLSLQTRRLSPGSMANYRHALKHFYEMNDIALNWKKINKFARMEDNSTLRQKDRAYTHQEIQQMLAQSNEKVRAIILLLASSGIRVGAVSSLCIRHLTHIDEYKLYQLLIYAGHKDQYITFCTPEASKAIDSYLSYRKRCGEKLADASPLFRTDFYAPDLFKVRNKIKPLSTVGVSIAVRDALHRAGLLPTITISTEPAIRHEVQRNHGFRKFANTQMVQAKVDAAAKEMLLGHSIGLDDKYYRPTSQQLLDEYLKAVDLLTINEENRLRRKVEELTIKTSDISVLKNQIDELRDMFTKKN
jgi:site-specific recombinase XerD